MRRCFVIQPFDKGKFDKRFKDVFAPAIRSAGLEPYRIDEDWDSDVPIEQIETGLRDSIACVADISTDNPNVWYELGYAMASGTPCCLVCSSERNTKYPFDIQHRSVIRYGTDSKSDYEELEARIVNRLTAILQRPEPALTPAVATSDATTDTISVVLTSAMRTEEWEVTLPPDVQAQRIIEKLLKTVELGFRVRGIDGQPLRYSLRWKEGGRALGESETLRQAGVTDGNTLIMVVEAFVG